VPAARMRCVSRRRLACERSKFFTSTSMYWPSTGAPPQSCTRLEVISANTRVVAGRRDCKLESGEVAPAVKKEVAPLLLQESDDRAIGGEGLLEDTLQLFRVLIVLEHDAGRVFPFRGRLAALASRRVCFGLGEGWIGNRQVPAPQRLFRMALVVQRVPTALVHHVPARSEATSETKGLHLLLHESDRSGVDGVDQRDQFKRHAAAAAASPWYSTKTLASSARKQWSCARAAKMFSPKVVVCLGTQ